MLCANFPPVYPVANYSYFLLSFVTKIPTILSFDNSPKLINRENVLDESLQCQTIFSTHADLSLNH